ncbi:hypothetical protein [Daejeonella oryzae]|uniref:hypothetical protein n=1 Tax=Daejeonella oryzae TaxID=1122943 RepID=UPI00040D96D3|nr:hypothetical protein [Daejeonella oryzae]
MITIRAFRAIDDYDACEKFMWGHRKVLENIGVKKLTSSKDEWMTNPAAFVIIVETEDRSKVYGGARVNVAGGTQQLPIEEATGYLDDSIYKIVKEHAITGTGEICGLWNSREVTGMGIGSVFLTRACVAICKFIGLQTLFGLAAPYTVKMAQDVGYQILDTIGNNGTFYYPKLDLVATALVLNDVNTIMLAEPFEKERIFSLREDPNQLSVEILRKKELEIQYYLQLPNIESWYNSGIIERIIR